MKEEKKQAIINAREKMKNMEYPTQSNKNLLIAALDLRVMADSIAKTIQQEFPDNDCWDELYQSFEKTIGNCLKVSNTLFNEYINQVCKEEE